MCSFEQMKNVMWRKCLTSKLKGLSEVQGIKLTLYYGLLIINIDGTPWSSTQTKNLMYRWCLISKLKGVSKVEVIT